MRISYYFSVTTLAKIPRKPQKYLSFTNGVYEPFSTVSEPFSAKKMPPSVGRCSCRDSSSDMARLFALPFFSAIGARKALNFYSGTIDPSSHEAPPCRFTYAGNCEWRFRYLRIDPILTPTTQNNGTSDCCERCLFRLQVIACL